MLPCLTQAEADSAEKKNQLKDQFVVQYSGNHGRTHDLLSLVKAAEILKDKEDIKFLFIGSGSGKKALVNYAINKDLNNIIFEDYVDYSDLNYALNASDLFIISFKEGMAGISVPSRLYNLMAAEKPILAAVDSDSEVAQVIHEENIGKSVAPNSPSKWPEDPRLVYNGVVGEYMCKYIRFTVNVTQFIS